MSDEGWIKLHRSLLDDALWRCSTDSQKVLLVVILMLANHKDNEWIWNDKKFICKRGQFITSLRSLAEKAQISKKAVEGALSKFEKYGFLGTQKGTGGTLITVCNYYKYQSDEREGGHLRGQEGDTKGTPRGHNKNDKNDKKIKNIRVSQGDPPDENVVKIDPTPYKKIVEIYHNTLPQLRSVITLNDSRKTHIKARWKNELDSLEEWQSYFEIVSKSDFLMGRTDPLPPRTKPFEADFDWLIKSSNVIKVCEGKYKHGHR